MALRIWISFSKLSRMHVSVTPAAVGQLIQVAARNSNIQQLVLANLRFSAASLTLLLQVSHSVTKLYIQRCQVEEDPGLWEDGFVKALHENKVLEDLNIHDVDMAYMAPIVDQLRSHSTLKVLQFFGRTNDGQRGPLSLATSTAIRSLLESGTSLQIHCDDVEFDRQSFLPIARGAIDGKHKHCLAFLDCTFDEASTDLFASMFQPKSSLHFLEVHCGSVWVIAKPTQAMLANILHKDSPLEKLSVRGLDSSVTSAIMKELEVNTMLRYL